MQGFEYHVDIVLCIDATGSMQPLIDSVKENALRFYGDVQEALNKKDKLIDKMRVRVIAYRDVFCDGDQAFHESNFFSLPDDAEAFERFVRELSAKGGGDEPESGLEALALATNSDWTKGGSKQRHIVLLWTDASAHPLERATPPPPNYPRNMPANLNDLTDIWSGQDMSFSAKRLILFAPDVHPWSAIGAQAGGWENVIWYPSRAGAGLNEVTYQEIINAIVNSVG